MLHVKVCGITRAEDALLAASLGATTLGFIFWPETPRFVDPYRARAIVAQLPPGVSPVGVFVDQPIDYVRGVATLVKLGAVQLHGREPLEYYRQLSHRVIKAMAIAEDSPIDSIDEVPPDVTVLLDAHDPVRVGGTGKRIDWRVAATIARRRRIILSGGLRSDNVGEAIRTVRPYGVDVSSGVEKRPGVKDPARLRRFFEAVHQAADPATAD